MGRLVTRGGEELLAECKLDSFRGIRQRELNVVMRVWHKPCLLCIFLSASSLALEARAIVSSSHSSNIKSLCVEVDMKAL